MLKIGFKAFVVDNLMGYNHSHHTQEIRDTAVHCWGLLCHHFKGNDLPSVFKDTMFNIYVQSLNNEDTQMSDEQIVSIVKGLMALFCSVRNYKKAKKSILFLMQTPYRNLATLTSVDGIIRMLRVIHCILANCNLDKLQFQWMMSNECHLSIKLLDRLWPHFTRLLQNQYYMFANEDISKYMVLCIESVMRECGDKYADSDLFEPVLRSIVSLYCNGLRVPSNCNGLRVPSYCKYHLDLLAVYLEQYPDKNAILDTILKGLETVENDKLLQEVLQKIYRHCPGECQEWLERKGKEDIIGSLSIDYDQYDVDSIHSSSECTECSDDSCHHCLNQEDCSIDWSLCSNDVSTNTKRRHALHLRTFN